MRKICLILVVILLVGTILVFSVEQMVIVNVLEKIPSLDVFSPINDSVYSERKVVFNLTTDEVADSISYFDLSDSRNDEKKLCRDCSEYGFYEEEKVSFRDGFHRLEIVADFGDEKVSKFVEFIVDTKDPKIGRTEPKRGLTNGNFEVEFKEDNPSELILHYGNFDEGFREEEMSEFSSCFNNGRRMVCSVLADLSEFDGQEIIYWFELDDITGKKDSSRRISLLVDQKSPIVEFFEYNIEDNGRVEFLFNISEEHFDEITYLDLKDYRSREKVLCSTLKFGICKKIVSFRNGDHEIEFKVKDKAGNVVLVEEVVFNI